MGAYTIQTCKMKLIAFLASTVLSTDVVDGGAGTPCPSDCWNWDAANEKCLIKDNNVCFDLTCGYDKITIKFDSKLFAVEDNAVTPFTTDATYSWNADDSRWVVECNLGECSMGAANEDFESKNHLVFTIPLAKQMNSMTLSNNEVFINPVTASLDFKCRYLADIDLTSDAFTVKGATATGETTESGALDAGFSLAMYTDAAQSIVADGTNIFVGYPVYADVAWSIATLNNVVKYYINGCSVINTDTNAAVDLIKNTCYSSSLGARQLQADKVVQSSSKFTFIAFTIGAGDASQMETLVSCGIKLCLVSDTACMDSVVSTDNSCPADAADAPYAYKALTYVA